MIEVPGCRIGVTGDSLARLGKLFTKNAATMLDSEEIVLEFSNTEKGLECSILARQMVMDTVQNDDVLRAVDDEEEEE